MIRHNPVKRLFQSLMSVNWREKNVDATTRLLFSLMPMKLTGKDQTKLRTCLKCVDSS